MTPKTIQLSKRLTLDTVQTDKFKTEVLSVSLLNPVDAGRSPKSLLALSVLKRGTVGYPSQEALNIRLDELFAASLNLKSFRYGDTHVLGYSSEMLGQSYTPGTDVLEGVFEVIEQMLFYPLTDEKGLFPEKNVESEKNNQCDAIASIINNPKAYAAMRCREIMFEGDAYGSEIWGSEETICAITRDELKEAYEKLVYGSRYAVSYTGARDPEEVRSLVEKYLLRHLSDKSDYAVAVQTPAVGIKRDIRRVTETLPLSQGKLVMGFRAGVSIRDADIFSMMLMNEIFGASPVSKLFMNVREKYSLCYYCSSRYDIYKGVMFVSSGINPENKDKTEKEILKQFELVQKGRFGKDELEAARRSMINSYRSLYDSPLDVINYYMGRAEFGVFYSVEDTIRHLSEVTAKDVVRVAQKVTPDIIYFLDGNGEEEQDAD